MLLNSVVEDFNSDLSNLNKNIKINVNILNLNGTKLNVLGVESKLEQIIANLLDNAVSFSPPNSKILVICGIKKKQAQLIIEDEGPGFNEKNINKVFNRFYSNRPEKFGEHSGLGSKYSKKYCRTAWGLNYSFKSSLETKKEQELRFYYQFINN